MSLTKVTNSMIKGAVASVLDYGADNTGADDSATAISNAIASGAGVVELPAGTYKIASTISIPSNVILLGQGFGTSGAKTTISYTGSGNAVEYVGTSGTPVRWGGIENISITAASSCNAVLRVKGAREGSFTNVSLIGASNADYCLLVEADTNYGTYYNTFTQVEGVGSAIANLLVNGDVATTGTARANGNSFFDCRFDSGNGVGMSLSGCDQIDFFGQAVEGNTGTGVVIGVSGETEPTRVSFFGGYIENQSATYDLDSSNASTGGNGPINFFATRISSAKIAPGSLYRNYGMAGQIVSETDVILERPAANTLATDGTFQVGRGGDARYNEGILRLGTYYLWVDTSDRLRIKSSAPTSDTDGVIVGTQS